MPTVNERCKILRSLNRVYVFEIVLLLVPRLKILRRRGLSYFRIFEKQEAQSSSQETNHNSVAWHLFLCRVSLRVECAAQVCGTRWPLSLGTCPCAVGLAGGVPLWRALWPRVGAPRLVRSGRSPCSSRLSRRRGAFPHPGGLRPRIYWAAARGTWRPAENRALYACRWPLPRQGLSARSALYPFVAPQWGCLWRVPPASVLGCVRCGGWRVWTRSLTRRVSRTARLSTGDSVGAPGLFRVDGDTSPCRSEDATPGSRACVRARALLGQVGRAGLPGAFWCASPFPVAAFSLFFVWPPPGLGRPVCCVFFFSSSLCPPPLSPAFGVFLPGVPSALVSCSPPPLSPPPFFCSLVFCSLLFFSFFFCSVFFPFFAGCAVRCRFVCSRLWVVLVRGAVGAAGCGALCVLPGAVWRACAWPGFRALLSGAVLRLVLLRCFCFVLLSRAAVFSAVFFLRCSVPFCGRPSCFGLAGARPWCVLLFGAALSRCVLVLASVALCRLVLCRAVVRLLVPCCVVCFVAVLGSHLASSAAVACCCALRTF